MPEANITKRVLGLALKQIMAEKPFAKISVGEICDNSGLSRRSFYYHFQDKYELAIWIFESEFLDLIYEKNYDSSWDFLLDICVYFYTNSAFYLGVLKVSGQNSFREYYTDFLTPLMKRSLEPEFQNHDHAAFFAGFFADALVVSLEKWLEDGSMAPREYVGLLRLGIENTARRVMHEMETHPRNPSDAPAASPEG